MNLPSTASNKSTVYSPVSVEMEDLMNKVSGHTANAGRDMYDTSNLVDEINLMKAANEAKFTDLNMAHEFSRDGSGNNPSVSVIRRDNNIVVVTNKLSPLQPQRKRVPVGSARARHNYNFERDAMNVPLAPSSGSVTKHTAQTSAVENEPAERQHVTEESVHKQVNNSTAKATSARHTLKRQQPSTPKSKAVNNMLTEASPPRSKKWLATTTSPRRNWIVEVTHRNATCKQCETCGHKTANFGVAANLFRKQWCKACGLTHGVANSASARHASGFTGYARGASAGHETGIEPPLNTKPQQE
jgi:hypothetical protein